MFTSSRVRGVSYVQAFSQAGGTSKPGLVMGMLLTAVPSLGKVIGERTTARVLVGVTLSRRLDLSSSPPSPSHRFDH